MRRSNTIKSQSAVIKNSDNADHIYYNLNLTNPNTPNNNLVLANFNDTRSTSILDIPSEYTMSVIRFSISKANIPIFFMNVFPHYSLVPSFRWNTNFTYILNQGVIGSDGNTYISLLSSNSGFNPVISPLQWRFVPSTAQNWNNKTVYNTNTGVIYNNVVYVSLQDGNVNNTPNTSPTFWGISQLPPVLNNICPNFSEYQVSLVYESLIHSNHLIYEPSQIQPLPNDWSIIEANNANYYAVNIFSQFIDMINKALKSAYNRIDPTSPPKMAGAQAPYLQYDPNTLLISLVAHKTFDPNYVRDTGINSNGHTIEIYFNTTLMTFFKDALQYDSNHGFYPSNLQLDYKLTVQGRGNNEETLLVPDIGYSQWQNTLNYFIGEGVQIEDGFGFTNYVAIANSFNKNPLVNPTFWQVQAQIPLPSTYVEGATYAIGQVVSYLGNYYVNITGVNTTLPSALLPNWNFYTGFDMLVMRGDYANLYNWVDIQSILFVSQLVPIVDEFVPAGRVNSNTTLGTLGPSNPTLQIISDFIPQIETGTDINSNIAYFTPGEYRLANLVSDTPMRTIKIQIYYTDRYNQLFPLYLEPYGVASCKILFRKKSVKSGLTYTE